jgi:hypothetical protein
MEQKIEKENKKKKIFIIIPILIVISAIIIILVMYIINSPQIAISNFFKGLKESDKNIVNKYIDYNQIANYIITDDVSTDVEAKIEANCFKDIKYKINAININNDEATVTIETTNKNFRNVLTLWTQEIYQKLISGNTMSNQEQKELLNTYLEKDDIGTITVTKDITLYKDNKAWKIKNNQNLEDSLFPGLSEVVNTVNSLVKDEE